MKILKSNSARHFSFAVLFSAILSVSSAFAAAPSESIGFTFVEQAVTDPSGMQVEAFDELTGLKIADAQIQVAALPGSTTLKVVHARRTGYAGASVYGIRGGFLKIMLHPDSAMGTSAVAKGELLGYLPFLPGHVDGGIILRTLGVSDLLSLNVDSLLSPLKDEIRLLGKREIPSNIVFPKQTVSVIVKLNKPVYRLPMSTGRYTGLVGAQAAIPVADLLGLPAKPDPVDFANLLKLRKLGFTERMNPSGDFGRDIPLTTDLGASLQVKMENIPYDSNLYALSLIDMNDDRQHLAVADVKGVRKGSYDKKRGVMVDLVAPTSMPSGSMPYAIAAAMSEDGNQLSATVLNATSKKVSVNDLFMAPKIGIAPKDAMDVTALSASTISALTISEKLTPTGARSHRVFVLPEAGKAHIEFQTVFPGVVLDQLGLSQMEFAAVDPRSIDGVDIARHLKRFTYSISDQ